MYTFPISPKLIHLRDAKYSISLLNSCDARKKATPVSFPGEVRSKPAPYLWVETTGYQWKLNEFFK